MSLLVTEEGDNTGAFCGAQSGGPESSSVCHKLQTRRPYVIGLGGVFITIDPGALLIFLQSSGAREIQDFNIIFIMFNTFPSQSRKNAADSTPHYTLPWASPDSRRPCAVGISGPQASTDLWDGGSLIAVGLILGPVGYLAELLDSAH